MTGSWALRDHRRQLCRLGWDKEEPMSHRQAIADRARDRGAARRVHRRGDDARRGPHGVGGHRRRRSCRCPPSPPSSAAGGRSAPGAGGWWPSGDCFVQTTRPGTIALDGDTTTGPAYIQELGACPRRPPGADLRHLPRPLPAHRRRVEVHRAGLRGRVPRHQPVGGLGARLAGAPADPPPANKAVSEGRR